MSAPRKQSQWQWEHTNINQKISFDGGISESGGNVAAARMTARAARAGATRRQQRGITALMAARTGVVRQQWWRRQWKQCPGRGERDGNNSGKSGGDAAMTAARTIARDTQQDEDNAVTVTGYYGNGGGKVISDGGGESEGQRGNDSRVPRRWRRW